MTKQEVEMNFYSQTAPKPMQKHFVSVFFISRSSVVAPAEISLKTFPYKGNIQYHAYNTIIPGQFRLVCCLPTLHSSN